MKLRSGLSWGFQLTCWAIMFASIFTLAAAVFVPRVTGATPYTILTGSMDPTYPPGTLVIVKPEVSDKLETGDVITYQLESGKAAVVTHRIVSKGASLENERIFQTKGDANNAIDENPVMPVQIRGKAWYSIPYIGYVSESISPSDRGLATYIIAGGLLFYTLYSWSKFFVEHSRAKNAYSKPGKHKAALAS